MIFDIADQTFGKLEFIEITDKRKRGYVVWKCLCECGNEVLVKSLDLQRGNTKSCGCIRSERGKTWVKGRTLKLNEASFKSLFRGYRTRAKRKGIPFELTDKQFKKLNKQNCYYCGIFPQQTNNVNGNGAYIYNGIDRVDNSKGYILENCVPCCGRCNKAKSTMTQQEFYKLIESIYKNKVERSKQWENTW